MIFNRHFAAAIFFLHWVWLNGRIIFILPAELGTILRDALRDGCQFSGHGGLRFLEADTLGQYQASSLECGVFFGYDERSTQPENGIKNRRAPAVKIGKTISVQSVVSYLQEKDFR